MEGRRGTHNLLGGGRIKCIVTIYFCIFVFYFIFYFLLFSCISCTIDIINNKDFDAVCWPSAAGAGSDRTRGRSAVRAVWTYRWIPGVGQQWSHSPTVGLVDLLRRQLMFWTDKLTSVVTLLECRTLLSYHVTCFRCFVKHSVIETLHTLPAVSTTSWLVAGVRCIPCAVCCVSAFICSL